MTTSAVSRLGRSPEEGIKAPCKSSTTGPITLAGTGQILNGVTMNTSDRALVKDQAQPGFNGIYIVGPDAWERANDMNASEDVDNGQLVVDANSGVLYSIVVSGIWSPDAVPINFIVFLAGMPGEITLTNANAVDLVDIDVPLVLGSLTPAASQHLEFDFQSVQSKSNNTTASVLFLNPLGGDVNILDNLVIGGLVDGVDVSAHAAVFVAHAADATIHFTEGSIDHTAIQNVGSNDHAAIDTHIADATIHFTEASIDHTAIQNIGSNDHAAIDTHIGDATIHFLEGAIDHVNILNIGSNSHAAIDTHIGDATIHFTELALLKDADGDTQILVEESADEDIIRFDLGDNITGFPALANALLFSAGQFTLTLPAANVATTVGAPISLTTGAGNTTGVGGNFSILTGDGGQTDTPGGDFIIEVGTGAAGGASGNVFINTTTGIGAQGGSIDTTEAPGLVSIYGVNSSGNIQAGNVEIWGGYSTGVSPAKGGDLMFFGGGAGGSPGVGGDVWLFGGEADSIPGDVHLVGGTPTVGGNGAMVTVIGGSGFGAGARQGGDVTFEAGPGLNGGDGGDAFIIGGEAGATGNGGTLDMKGGDATSGIGGICTLRGGNVATVGAGGRMQMLGGEGGGVSDRGGDVWLIVGQGGNNIGAAGNLFINSTTGAGSQGGSIVVEAGEAIGLVSIYGVGTLDDNLAGNVEIWGGYAAGTGAGAVGGELILTGGEGGATAGFGGDLVLAGGAGNTPGDILTNSDIILGASFIQPPVALANSATPSVAGGRIWLTGGVITITDLTGGSIGQEVIIMSEHAITISDNANFFLAGGDGAGLADFVMASSDSLHMVQKADGNWYEITRSVN